jgi:hypothetical protein
MGRPSRVEPRLERSLGVPIKLLFLDPDADEGTDGGTLVEPRRSRSSHRSAAARDRSTLWLSRALKLGSIAVALEGPGPCRCECECEAW